MRPRQLRGFYPPTDPTAIPDSDPTVTDDTYTSKIYFTT